MSANSNRIHIKLGAKNFNTKKKKKKNKWFEWSNTVTLNKIKNILIPENDVFTIAHEKLFHIIANNFVGNRME